MPTRRSNIFLIILQCIRITNLKPLVDLLANIKRKNDALATLIQMITVYIILAHFLACIWILIGRLEPDFNNSWFIMIPIP